MNRNWLTVRLKCNGWRQMGIGVVLDGRRLIVIFGPMLLTLEALGG